MAKLISSQVEQLREIGAYLRQVRQDQGIEIEDIANQIFIRPLLLRSLEAGDEAHLPEPVFVQGFIRRYADALGVDGQALSQEFSVTPVAVLTAPDATELTADNGSVESPPTHSPDGRSPGGEQLSGLKLSPWMLLGSLGALVVLFLLAWGLSRPPANEPTEDTSQAAPTTGDAQPDPGSTEEPQPQIEAEPEMPAALEAPVVAEVSLSQRSWLSVTVDGENVFEGVLESGAQEKWTAQDTIVLTSGNAGGVDLAFNGNPAVVMGDSGTVRTLTLTPDTNPDTLMPTNP